MRTDAKTDTNQTAVMHTFRRAGCFVQSLATIGKGCPDLLVALGGTIALVEVKDGNKPPSAQKLTADQIKWHAKFPAKVWIVRNDTDVANVVMWLRARMPREATA